MKDYVNFRMWPQTLRKLSKIRGETGETMIAIVDRLATEELKPVANIGPGIAYRRGDVLTKDSEMTTVIVDITVTVRDDYNPLTVPFVYIELGYPDDTIPHKWITPQQLVDMLAEGWQKKIF